jgi:hypothetical protein
MMAVERVARKQKEGSLVIGKKALRDAVADTDLMGITGKIRFDHSSFPFTPKSQHGSILPHSLRGELE